MEFPTWALPVLLACAHIITLTGDTVIGTVFGHFAVSHHLSSLFDGMDLACRDFKKLSNSGEPRLKQVISFATDIAQRSTVGSLL
jgi:hypothetical protein